MNRQIFASECSTIAKIRVEAHSRLHMTLIDLNGNLGRVDGGFGMALKKPVLALQIEENNKTSLEPYSELLDMALKKAKKEFNYKKGVKVRVLDDYPQHIGLGHETQMMLAVGSAISRLKGIDISSRDLACIMRRGGTSGIGVGTFETGGFLVDAGHSFGRNKVKSDFSSSTYSRAPPPPVIFRCEFPEDWKVFLVIPDVTKRLFGKAELNLFKRFCPIPATDVEKISRIVLFQVIPSMLEKDLVTLGEALSTLRRIGFKRIEMDQQHPVVKETVEAIEKSGIKAVGLSSMGPTVFAICSKRRDTSELVSSLENIGRKHSLKYQILETEGYNNGASLGIVEKD